MNIFHQFTYDDIDEGIPHEYGFAKLQYLSSDWFTCTSGYNQKIII